MPSGCDIDTAPSAHRKVDVGAAEVSSTCADPSLPTAPALCKCTLYETVKKLGRAYLVRLCLCCGDPKWGVGPRCLKRLSVVNARLPVAGKLQQCDATIHVEFRALEIDRQGCE
jgi:hypothetical protein